VQRVGDAVGELVLRRVAQVEDVVRVDADLADQGAGRLEVGERGQLLVCGRRKRDAERA